MRDLSYILERCFNCADAHNFNRVKVPPAIDRGMCFMTIPISEDSFEIPMLAMPALKMTNVFQAQSLVVQLDYLGAKTEYKSLDAAVRNVLEISYPANHLIEVPSTPSEPYYGAQGTLFNKNFLPVMMVSWLMEKVYSDESHTTFKLRFVQPILRISPDVFLRRSNSVERYIINKIIPAVLSFPYVWTPRIMGNGVSLENPTQCHFKPKVVIESCPFLFSRPSLPSISTTNEQLLNVALAHMDEMTTSLS